MNNGLEDVINMGFTRILIKALDSLCDLCVLCGKDFMLCPVSSVN